MLKKSFVLALGIWTAVILFTLPGETAAAQNIQWARTWLKVALYPIQAVNAGAGWRLQGETAWRRSGEEVAIDNHKTIEFKDVPGFIQPPAKQVTLTVQTAGGIIDISQAYEPQPGSLAVTIFPPNAVIAGAQWGTLEVSSGGSGSGGGISHLRKSGTLIIWKNSGETIPLDVGQYDIVYKVIPGWYADPGSDRVEIKSGQTTTFTRTLAPTPGKVLLTIEPAKARDAGAQWRVDGGAWQSSGSTLPGIPPGQHNIDFTEIAGWTKPQTIPFNLLSGETANQTGRYAEKPGSVTVTLGPQEAVMAGAKWRAGHHSAAAARPPRRTRAGGTPGRTFPHRPSRSAPPQPRPPSSSPPRHRYAGWRSCTAGGRRAGRYCREPSRRPTHRAPRGASPRWCGAPRRTDRSNSLVEDRCAWATTSIDW